jgi:hypothetical protein
VSADGVGPEPNASVRRDVQRRATVLVAVRLAALQRIEALTARVHLVALPRLLAVRREHAGSERPEDRDLFGHRRFGVESSREQMTTESIHGRAFCAAGAVYLSAVSGRLAVRR